MDTSQPAWAGGESGVLTNELGTSDVVQARDDAGEARRRGGPGAGEVRRRGGPLVAACFSDTHGPPHVRALRGALLRACSHSTLRECKTLSPAAARTGSRKATSNASSAFEAIGVGLGSGGRQQDVTALVEPPLLAIARLYASATFCLQPPGDAISRKGVVDALLLGCIPVLLHAGQGAQWPWHWGAWQANASVTLDSVDVLHGRDPIDLLRRIPTPLVRRMQRTIASRAHSMQYSLPQTREAAAPAAAMGESARGRMGGLKDALEVALARLLDRAADVSVIARGITLQQTRGAVLTSALEAFAREPHIGYCSRTSGAPGDCESGWMGSWDVGLGYEHGMVSIDDCEQKCRACKRCHYISFSHAHTSCDWYASCRLSRLDRSFGGHSYRTRQVRQEPAFRPPPRSLECNVTLRHRLSSAPCLVHETFGCYRPNVSAGIMLAAATQAPPFSMWIAYGCRGHFELDGHPLHCASADGGLHSCAAKPSMRRAGR